jgi:membrane protein implicated in regulation of membrane protease activity
VLDRVLKLIVTLTLLLFLMQAVIGVLSRVIEAALINAVSVVGQTGSFLGSLLVAVAMACFLTGLVVRFVQFVATRDPRAARERASRERAMRQRVRRPAEGVPPVNNQREHPADSDPGVGEDEEVH